MGREKVALQKVMFLAYIYYGNNSPIYVHYYTLPPSQTNKLVVLMIKGSRIGSPNGTRNQYNGKEMIWEIGS